MLKYRILFPVKLAPRMCHLLSAISLFTSLQCYAVAPEYPIGQASRSLHKNQKSSRLQVLEITLQILKLLPYFTANIQRSAL